MMSTLHNGFQHAIVKGALQALLLSFGVLSCLPAHSQNLGRISGMVTDTSGGAIAGASVTVLDVGRGIPRVVTTDGSGTYSAPNLTPGTYSVHVGYMGFRAFDRQDVTVGVGGDIAVDVTLQPGEQNQTVTVTGEAPSITTTNAQLSATIPGNSLSDLPIAGHQLLQLIGMLPAYHIRPGSNTGPQSQVSNGLRGEYTVVSLDGVPDQQNYYLAYPLGTGHAAGGSEQAILLPADTIEEFNLVQNAKAETGWGAGAQIQIGIKSGTNALHGTAYALGRNAALTARNAFSPLKPPSEFEYFGASFGGPIKKDKFFYLVGYEGQRFSVGNPRISNVPTTLSLATGTNPAGSPSTSLPDAVNDLLAHGRQPSPLSLALAGCVTAPTVRCTPNAGLFSNNTQSPNFLIDPLSFGTTDNGLAKVDYHLNDHHNLAAEYYNGDGIAVEPVSSVNQQYWSTPMEVHTQVARAWWTWAPNSTIVNDLRFGLDHVLMPTSPSYDCPTRPAGDSTWVAGSGAPNYASLGFVGGGTTCGLPSVTITGFAGNVLGGATGFYDVSNFLRGLDSVSWTHGNHITKFGGEFVHQSANISINLDRGKGFLNFATTNPALNAFPTATALDNFMAGIVTSAQLQTGTLPRRFTDNQFALFIQDDWRILPRLTLNIGLRYENAGAYREANDLFGSVALGSPTGLIQQGQNGLDPLYKLSPWAFGPRFGASWDVTGKGTTVVRAGFNIIYADVFASTLLGAGAGLQAVPTGLNLSNGSTVINEGGTINLATLTINPPGSPIPWAPNVPVFGNYATTSLTCSPTTPCNVGGVARRLAYPEVLNWNFGVQHAITKSLTLDVEYVGNHGQHEFGSADLNQPIPGSANRAQEQQRRPLFGQYPWLGAIRVLGDISQVSNYDALQIVARERASHGLTFIATYTYSHSLDDSNSDMTPPLPQDSTNPGAEYGNSNWDLRHRFTFGPSYELPGTSGFAQMLQGWRITSTVFIDSGRPITALDSGVANIVGGAPADDLSGTGEAQDRWSLVGNAHDFHGFGTFSSIPCFDNPGTASSAWRSACSPGLPQQCLTAAAGEQRGPGGTTGTTSLLNLGCYMMGSSVIVPPAQGTFGTMSRNQIFGVGYWSWDMSIVKSWRIRERLSTEFRAEVYNVTNSVKFAPPNVNLNAPSLFGRALGTPDVIANSPIIGTGGPRRFQFGLKFMF
jgi:hypothetical protein